MPIRGQDERRGIQRERERETGRQAGRQREREREPWYNFLAIDHNLSVTYGSICGKLTAGTLQTDGTVVDIQTGEQARITALISAHLEAPGLGSRATEHTNSPLIASIFHSGRPRSIT